jgi:asparagine synthase (glutamine-hydrolysing)
VTATIASLSKNGQNIVPTVLRALESLQLGECWFVLSSPSAIHKMDNIQNLKEAGLVSAQAVGCVFPKRLKHLAPKFMKIGNTTSLLMGTLYSLFLDESVASSSGTGVFLQNERAMESLLKKSEGDFAVITVKPGKILAARDPVGVQPLYSGENADLVALATNRTALWKMGIQNPRSFPSGNLESVTRKGLKCKPVKLLCYSRPKRISMDDAARILQEILEYSVRVRVHGVKELAVAFSGGLDSSIVAFLAKRCGAHVRLIHVSLSGQSETEQAKKAAEELKLPLCVHLFEASDVEKTVPKVVRLIEEPDPMKTAVGVPFYWVAQKTAEAEIEVLLAGQGADELFGGYQRYVTKYLLNGGAAVQEAIFHDVVNLPENNLERDKKICSFRGVDLRLPFASFGLAEFALSLPIDLKIERKEDGLRKLVLRQLAKNVGLSEAIVTKPKKAVQYATGVNAEIRKLALERGLTVGEYLRSFFVKEKVDE